MVVWWCYWTFETCRRFWHKLVHPSAWWATNILLWSAYAIVILHLSGFCKSPRELLSWHILLPRGLSISNKGGRSLFCIKHPSQGRIVRLGPSASLWRPSRPEAFHFLGRRLMAWSNCFQSLPLAHSFHYLWAAKFGRKIIPNCGQACVLLR